MDTFCIRYRGLSPPHIQVRFHWRKDPLMTIRSSADEEDLEPASPIPEYGFIAQEVEQIFPDLVHTNAETGFKSLNYMGFTPLLLEAVKEQDETITALRIHISRLEQKLDKLSRLEERVGQLEDIIRIQALGG